MPEHADILIIGAGTTGAATAWALAKRDKANVVLLERRAAGAGTTARSCAIVRMHYMHEPLSRMALASRGTFERWGDEVGGDSGFRPVGWLSLAHPDDADALAANVAMHREVGIDSYLLTPSEAGELVPGMRVDDVGAAAWEPDSGYADPIRTAETLVAAAQRLGVRYRSGVSVAGLGRDGGSGWRVETSGGTFVAGRVLVAAGVLTGRLVAEEGVELPLTMVRHTVAVTRRPDGSQRPVVSDRVVGSYYRPTDGGETLVGATGAFDGRTGVDVDTDPWPAPDDVEVLRDRYADRFPDAPAPRLVAGYTSIYDCTPDLMPLLGPVDGLDGLSVAVGFSGHGFKIAPAIGELLADALLDEQPSEVHRFRPSRFAEGDAFAATHQYVVPTLG